MKIYGVYCSNQIDDSLDLLELFALRSDAEKYVEIAIRNNFEEKLKAIMEEERNDLYAEYGQAIYDASSLEYAQYYIRILNLNEKVDDVLTKD